MTANGITFPCFVQGAIRSCLEKDASHNGGLAYYFGLEHRTSNIEYIHRLLCVASRFQLEVPFFF